MCWFFSMFLLCLRSQTIDNFPRHNHWNLFERKFIVMKCTSVEFYSIFLFYVFRSSFLIYTFLFVPFFRHGNGKSRHNLCDFAHFHFFYFYRIMKNEFQLYEIDRNQLFIFSLGLAHHFSHFLPVLQRFYFYDNVKQNENDSENVLMSIHLVGVFGTWNFSCETNVFNFNDPNES